MALDGKQFGHAMNTIAYGNTMMAAIRDYQKEIEEQSSARVQKHSVVDVDGLLDDKELQQLHADRIAQLQQEQEKRAELTRKGHGQYQEITEADFLECVTKAQYVVCHFFHKEFERCKIIDKHMQILARQYFDTRFIKLSAPDSPFFSLKLNIKVLPCIVSFKDGVSIDRIVGFEPFGRDDFPTELLEDKLMMAGVIAPQVSKEDEEDRTDQSTGTIRRSVHYNKSASDEDSDFDD